MKRYIALFLLIALCTCLFACGEKSGEAEVTTDAKTTAVESTAESIEKVDFSDVPIEGYVLLSEGDSAACPQWAMGADSYVSAKSSVAVSDSEGNVSAKSAGACLCAVRAGDEVKAFVICVLPEGQRPDSSAGEPMLFESGETYDHTAPIGGVKYTSADDSIVDVSEAPRLRFKNCGYTVVTAANASRPFFYSFIVFDREAE